MSGWVFQETDLDSETYEVGFYRWVGHTDHARFEREGVYASKDEAAARVHYLNGGSPDEASMDRAHRVFFDMLIDGWYRPTDQTGESLVRYRALMSTYAALFAGGDEEQVYLDVQNAAIARHEQALVEAADPAELGPLGGHYEEP